MYFLLNLSQYVKSYGHFCQTSAIFAMPAHQIWSCHVSQEANFENVLFCPNFTFNIRKSHKISSRKALYFRRYQPKTSRRGGKHTPSDFRVKPLLRLPPLHPPPKNWIVHISVATTLFLYKALVYDTDVEGLYTKLKTSCRTSGLQWFMVKATYSMYNY